jgi:lambda family phage portal protein
LNWLDYAIAYVSPVAGARRIYARMGIEAYRQNESRIRAFEAGKTGRRTSGWLTNGNSANSNTEFSLSTLRNRSRDLCENNVWAKRAINVIAGNTIGEGIIPRIRGTNDRQTQLIDDLFEDWSESPTCSTDERNDYYSIQDLVCRGVAMNGEAIVRRRWRRAGDSLAVPMQVQVLEADFLDTTKTEIESNGFFSIQGIRFNPIGRRVGYWLFDEHPGGNVTGRGYTFKSRLVDARDIIHVYRMERAGQVRGIPWGASCILRLRDFDELEDAVLMRQKIANMFTVFITSSDSSALPGIGNTEEEDEVTEMQPGLVEFLTNGKQVHFANPPAAEGIKDYSQLSLRAIAAGFDVTYEALAQDLSNVNFSSGRMGWTEFGRQVRGWRAHIYRPHLCRGVFQWFLEAAEMAGRNVSGVRATHTPPRREYVDPTKEIPAEMEAIRGGVKTPSEVVREQGKDFNKHLLEYKADLELMDRYGLKLEMDPRTGKMLAPVKTEAPKKETDDAEDA